MLLSYLEDPLLGGLVDQVSEHEAGEVSVEALVPGVSGGQDVKGARDR